MELNEFLDKAYAVLRRLDAVLPPEPGHTDWNALAFRWQSAGKKGFLEHLPDPHTFPLVRLAGVGRQTELLVRNTEQFIVGRPANNVLMSGARGTGKSSLVKALLHEYADKGLRLIEVDKSDLIGLPYLLTLLKERPEKFIVFCDDLSFESGDETYKALKTALDGGLSQRCANVLVYATSNRRHLMPEYFDENAGTTGMRGGESIRKKRWKKKYPCPTDSDCGSVFIRSIKTIIWRRCKIGWKISACRMMKPHRWRHCSGRRRGAAVRDVPRGSLPATGRAGCRSNVRRERFGDYLRQEESHICCCCGVRIWKKRCWISNSSTAKSIPDK